MLASHGGGGLGRTCALTDTQTQFLYQNLPPRRGSGFSYGHNHADLFFSFKSVRAAATRVWWPGFGSEAKVAKVTAAARPPIILRGVLSWVGSEGGTSLNVGRVGLGCEA